MSGDSNHSSYILNISILLCKIICGVTGFVVAFYTCMTFYLILFNPVSCCPSPYSPSLWPTTFHQVLFIALISLFLSPFCADIPSFLLMVFFLFSTYTHTLKSKNVHIYEKICSLLSALFYQIQWAASIFLLRLLFHFLWLNKVSLCTIYNLSVHLMMEL